MGEVAEGLVFDLAPLAIATPQEVGFVELALVEAPGGGYMDCTGPLCHASIIEHIKHKVKTDGCILVATLCNMFIQSIVLTTNDLGPESAARSVRSPG